MERRVRLQPARTPTISARQAFIHTCNTIGDDLAAVGRDIENKVLSRAVQWHGEHRILVNGKRTVVFY